MANTNQRTEQQFTQLALQQNMMYKNMHQIILQVNVLIFNQSNAGLDVLGDMADADVDATVPVGPIQCARKFSPGLPQGVVPHGRMPHGRQPPGFVSLGLPGGFPQWRQTQYRPMPPMHAGRYGSPPQPANQAPLVLPWATNLALRKGVLEPCQLRT